ncbi:hypothetical protein X797_002034 [Metarhizium robertsii]|uniref:Uncharacterized protein n=2 Tax=Metarhizium robertsii TaxID=568076 RepID=E9F044_METRA|nr:uncharacterized protein MAA_05643 [Metarhizium robertsii ARSEF 23]EFY98504.1 hypothetical protein MAA_05643 [Metarhizium robertsii ARSEF 23]EXV04361.1 hypothetical protein X797_002034 [Metarhizium robertsii]
MPESGWLQWTIILVLTALFLSLVVVAQVVATYWAAYLAAPQEIVTFIDTVDFSIQENESYDRDVAKVQRLEDKIRLGQLLREIQKGGDDLREQLNSLVVSDGATTLRTSTRLLWGAKRAQLEDRVRRLDLLRMRFLVVYMGIMTSVVDRNPPPPPPLPRDPEKIMSFSSPTKPSLKKSLTETVVKRPPLRRLTTQAIGHQENVITPHRKGWAGVVEELQTSPRMQQRHASIELAMAQPTP